jgi:uncharacterized protein YjbI with pentapeptide repeats
MCGAQAGGQSSWPRCGSQDCTGIQLPGQEFCLTHVEAAARAAFLAGLQPGSDLNLSGTPIGLDLLAALLEALKEDETPRFGQARFDWARFSGDAWFRGVQFGGDAWFRGVQFSGPAKFEGAQFGGQAEFHGAQFSGDAWFRAADFSEGAWFEGAHFSEGARFDGAHFSEGAGFRQAQFSGDTEFSGAQFSGKVGFSRAQFSAARVLGPLIVDGQLSLSQASFAVPIVIDVSTKRLSLVGVAFQEAATLRVRFAEIVLDGTSFTKPSTISFAETPFRTLSGSELEDHSLETGNRVARPRLLSLRLVDVSNLVLGNLDLSACLFQGAHNLERLRIEGPLRFQMTPGAWQVHVGRRRIPIWHRWVRRQALAEEHHFRAQQSSPRVGRGANRLEVPGWSPPEVLTPAWVEETTGQQAQTLGCDQLAALYRALRKGLEDQKNAPGAADFYYGEMEMRRDSPMLRWIARLRRVSPAVSPPDDLRTRPVAGGPMTPRTDVFVLWVYWLFSGYGLRAKRALVAFALLVPLFAIGFWLWGLNSSPTWAVSSWGAALRTSFESATSLLRPPPKDLSPAGEILDAVLRLLGATLLGLALFSLRGRIKR